MGIRSGSFFTFSGNHGENNVPKVLTGLPASAAISKDVKFRNTQQQQQLNDRPKFHRPQTGTVRNQMVNGIERVVSARP
jgi:hypothetical protein